MNVFNPADDDWDAAPGHRAGRGSQRRVKLVLTRGPVTAAPGHRAGRGSQHRHDDHVAGQRLGRLRPATEPGEDRNVGSSWS